MSRSKLEKHFKSHLTKEKMSDPVLVFDNISHQYVAVDRKETKSYKGPGPYEAPALKAEIDKSVEPKKSKDKESYDLFYKFVIIGDSGIGKTSLLLRYTDGVFSDYSKLTLGTDFKLRNILAGEKRVKLQIWDPALDSMKFGGDFHRGADGFVLAYDSTNRESFEHLNRWFQEIRRYNYNKSPIILVATKSDLARECEVEFEEAKRFAQQYNLLGPIATSSKEGTNVEDCFNILAEQLVEEQFHSDETNSYEQGKKSTQNAAPLNLVQALNNIDDYKAKRNLIKRELYFGALSTLFGGFTKTIKFEAADTLIEVLKGTKTIDFLVPYQGAYKQGKLGELYKQVEHLLPKAEETSELHLKKAI